MKEIIKNASQGVAPSIGGMEVACRFFWEVGLPVLEERFSRHIDRLAAGLVAAGSDCSGNDDETSRDYDWGPRFHVYLTHSDFVEIGASLQAALDSLPTDFDGVRCRPSGRHASRAYSIDEFFVENTLNGLGQGFDRAPQAALDWLKIPEPCLFEIAHGQVFYDPLGEFSERRREFAAYYPDDAWRKRLAAALYDCGRLGQQLMPRSLARDDYYTAEIAWWSFVQAAMKVGFLLNRRYAPARKWLYREFCKLPALSVEVTNLLWDGQCDIARRPVLVDNIASIYDAKLCEPRLTRAASDGSPKPLIVRAGEVSASIADPRIARLSVWADTVLA